MDTNIVLEIGGNQKPQAQFVPMFEGKKILQLDIDANQKPDIVGDAAKLPENLQNLYGIFASHVLEHFSYWDTEKILRHWESRLQDGGSLHIVVPSWEWEAREVLSENPSPVVFGHSFAGNVNQWDVHKCMFTMRNLRRLFEKVGLNVVIAKTGVYHVHYDGKDYPADQHYVCGIKGNVSLQKQ